jgi:hypothetical protein
VGFDAGAEFGGAERFADVVVGSDFARAIGFDETDLLAYYNEVCDPSAGYMASAGSPR